jgi:hypothetical protein
MMNIPYSSLADRLAGSRKGGAMGKKRKNAAKGEGTSLEDEVRGLCEAMLADPAIARFELAIDKGLARPPARDGP